MTLIAQRSFADNLVPHVLRYEGVLDYEHSLEQKITSGELLAVGSREEVEIRACAILCRRGNGYRAAQQGAPSQCSRV